MSDYYYSNLIYLKKSNIHGYGIFASEDIQPNTIIEKPKYTILPREIEKSFFYNEKEIDFLNKTDILDISNYIGYFNPLLDNFVYNLFIVFLSISSFANWAESDEDINCEFTFDLNSHLAYFKSTKYIKKDSELLIKKKEGPKTNLNN